MFRYLIGGVMTPPYERTPSNYDLIFYLFCVSTATA